MNVAVRTVAPCSQCHICPVILGLSLVDPGTARCSGSAPLCQRISSAAAPPRWGPAAQTGRRCTGWWGAASRSWLGSAPVVPRRLEGTSWGDSGLWSDPSSSASPSRWRSAASCLDTWTWTSSWGKRLQRWIWGRSDGQSGTPLRCQRRNCPERPVHFPKTAGRWGRSRRCPRRRWETGCCRRWYNQGLRADCGAEIFPAEPCSRTAESCPGAGWRSRTSPWVCSCGWCWSQKDWLSVCHWRSLNRIKRRCWEVAPYM